MKALKTLVGACTALGWVGASLLAPSCMPEPPSTSSPVAASSSSGFATEDPDPTKPHVAELNVQHGLPEIYHQGLLAPSRKRSFTEFVQRLEDIRTHKDSRIRGVLVVLGAMRMGFARSQEVAMSLEAVRKSGLSVVCHADEYNNATYWIAARGCDRIWVSPAGGVETVGVAAQVLYAARLLDQLKVDVEMLQVGRFKGASEPFTRQGPSDEARESLMGVLKALQDNWVAGIQGARPAPVKVGSLESGPFSPKEARERGLVDEIGYVEDARADIRLRTEIEEVVPRFGPGAKEVEPPAFVDLLRGLSGAGGGTDVPHVAVLRAIGAIGTAPSGSPLGDSDGIYQRELSQELQKLRMDESTKAVVIRIDSPGGSALASDLIWHDLMALRKAKPVIMSVGDMAASGGYYLACAGTRIFAEPASIVGSIGVVGGKFAVPRALAHIGVTAEIFSASDAPGAQNRAAYLSPFTSWDEETEKRMLATMTSVYELFLDRVSEGRQLPRDKVEVFAEGRIFGGEKGLELRMIDELGGLQRSIHYALEAAKLGPSGTVRVLGEESGLERLLNLEDDEMQEGARQSVAPYVSSVLARQAPELIGFVSSFQPMLHGERTLVAMPYAVLMR